MREVTLPDDRAAVHAVLSRRIREQPQSYTPHPGDLDWWWYHVDPRVPVDRTWFDDESVVNAHPPRREVASFGPVETLDDAIARSLDFMGSGPVEVGFVSDADHALEAALVQRGFEPGPDAMVVLLHDLDGLEPVSIDARWTIRALGEPSGGEDPTDSRADAARSAFQTTMPADIHRGRYRAFRSSVAYEASRDIVAIDADGIVGSFAVWWPDAASGLAQFEPVGTHQDHQRQRLSSAVLTRCMQDAKTAGMTTMRVMTHAGTPAVDFYEAVGFRRSSLLRWWIQPT